MHWPRQAAVLVALLVFLLIPEGSAGQGSPNESPARKSPPSQSPEVSRLAREAEAALKRGDETAAIRGYERLVKLSPNEAKFHSGLGMAYYLAGRPRDAVRPSQEALKLNPASIQDRSVLGASLAESGRCKEALPYLKKGVAGVSTDKLKRAIATDGVKCAMELNQQDDALNFLQRLLSQFPHDPEVLYLRVHVLSDLSTRASQELLLTAPGSYQVHMLNAEALEAQQKWDDAAEEYRRVLAMHQNMPGIHYLLGRLILSKPKTATTLDDAKREFEAELKIDPTNAGAHYVLGELARQSQDWPDAIDHFSRAVEYDPGFVDAMVELGRTLVTAGRASEAIAPLEKAAKLQPENPSVHYQLAAAYRRVGRNEDAQKETVAFQETSSKARQDLQDIRSAVTGRETPAQTEKPPQ